MSQDVLIIREAYENYNVITVDYSFYAPTGADESYAIPQIKIVSFLNSSVVNFPKNFLLRLLKLSRNFCLTLSVAVTT